jgi:soluble lytic murein transglycosylase-like protein
MVLVTALTIALASPDPQVAACRARYPRNTITCADLRPVFQAAARDHNLDPHLLEAVAWVESRCDPCALSHANARGVMQFIPTTWRLVQRHLPVHDPHHPADSIAAGAFYLAALLRWAGGDVVRALAAYNAGPVLGAGSDEQRARYAGAVLGRYERVGGP